MKMKKLTALALAGVLCLGMSTTAFAAQSVTPSVGDDTKVQKYNELTGEWEDDKGGIVSGNIYNSKDQQDKYTVTKIKEWKDGKDGKTGSDVLKADMLTALTNAQKKAEEKGETLNIKEDEIKNASFKYVTAGTYSYVDENGNEAKFDGKTANIRFELNGIDGIDTRYMKGQKTVYLMHGVKSENGGTEFLLMKGEVQYKDGKYFTVLPFDTLSPVAFVLDLPGGGNNDGTNVVVPPTSTPDDNNTITPTPDKNGNVTLDDIANAVVKKLQSSNVKVIRTSTGVSPKTGE